MGRINKKQKKILTLLNETNNGFLKREDFLAKLDESPDNILPDIKLLEKEDLIVGDYTLDDIFPIILNITPLGKAKLKENILTRLYDKAHENPWTVIPVVVMILIGLPTLYLHFEDIKSVKQIIHENELKESMPPTVSLKLELRNDSNGQLEFIPTFYIKKNSDRLFTMISYEPDISLNGVESGKIGGGFPATLRYERISEGNILFPSFYASRINYYDFFNHRNILTINYSIGIKDMDYQIIYRANETIEINSSLPSKNEPILFNWYQI